MKFIARVPANESGYKFVQTLKGYINTADYKIFVRYSGKRRTGFGGHTRKEDADSIRVYIENRNQDPHQPYFYDSLTGAWVSQWTIDQAHQQKLDEKQNKIDAFASAFRNLFPSAYENMLGREDNRG
jgi:hypothetical protein